MSTIRPRGGCEADRVTGEIRDPSARLFNPQ